MTFWVGQKVVCVDNKPAACYRDFSAREKPTVGAVYTVTRAFVRKGVSTVHLREIARDEVSQRQHGFDVGYRTNRFRPIVEAKTEVSFTTGADPLTDQFDNRRKVRKKVTI